MSTNNIPVSISNVSNILGINRRASINSSKKLPLRLHQLPDDILYKIDEEYKASITNKDFALILKNMNEKEAEKELLNITNYDRIIEISKLIPQNPRSYPNNMIPEKLKNLIKLINNRKDYLWEKEAEKELLNITNYDSILETYNLISRDPRSNPNNMIPDKIKILIKLINNRKDYLWIDNYIEKKLIVHTNIYPNKLKKIEEEFTNIKSIINNNRNDTDKFNVAQKQVNLISLQLKITKETEKNIVEYAQNIQKKLKAGNIYIDKDIIKVIKKTIDNHIKDAKNQLDFLENLQKKLVENLQKK
jgi:hypothetical protein